MPLSPNFQFAAPSKEQVAAPDYAGSLAKGLELGFMPAVKSTDLLNKMMQAKYNQFKSGPEYQNAMLDFLRGRGDMQNLQAQNLRMGIDERKGLNNLLNNTSSGNPGGIRNNLNVNPNDYSQYSPYDEVPEVPDSDLPPEERDMPELSSNVKKAGSSNQGTILDHGNPDLYHIDDMWEKNPIYRKAFQDRGLTKKQTIKTDPRTGITSTTIQYPSGKIEVKTNSGASGPIPLTNQLKTLHQNIVSGIPKVMDAIDDIIKTPSPVGVPGYKSDQQAKHKALVNSTAETYAKAKGWPNTNESIHRATQIIGRGLFESDEAYRARLRDVKKTLEKDKAESQKTLKRGSTEEAQSASSGALTYNPATGRLE